MINFIICDDNNMYVEKIKNIVENYMMNFDIECKYHLFEDYDPKFEHEMEKLSGFNICIFDIETKVGSGIDENEPLGQQKTYLQKYLQNKGFTDFGKSFF